jgi:cyclophilin family peptidyl-prolyl cis-trans isomerase
VTTLLVTGASSPAHAQLSRRLSVLQAEDRRAPTVADLAALRTAARSGDPLTARIGVRALGRLERPALIADIIPDLQHGAAEVRAEAANAVAQAARGLGAANAPRAPLGLARDALTARLRVESEASVRAVLYEAVARLPYTDPNDVEQIEALLVDAATRAVTDDDRLGSVKGFEALARLHRAVRPLGQPAVDLLNLLARGDASLPDHDRLRDARIRRLALEALSGQERANSETLTAAARDPDPQVRRLAIRAVRSATDGPVVQRGLLDPDPMVRIEALRAARTLDPRGACDYAESAVADSETRVTLVAIDLLGACQSESAVTFLAGIASDGSLSVESPRHWNRATHALVALASASPERAAAVIGRYAASPVWQLRVAAVRAAATLGDRGLLTRLGRDSDDNVVEAAIVALKTATGHASDDVYLDALSRDGDQVVRAAALALDGSPNRDIGRALTAALDRIVESDRPGAVDAGAALRTALASTGAPPRKPPARRLVPAPLDADELRRLGSPRARVTIRDLGRFEIALFTLEAPATVLRFAQLASSGYYDGLTFHRLVPNGIIQGGSPGANEFSSLTPLMRDEVGLWPHVRGAVGISTRGRDTGDGQIFIDLVDNPRYDHTYTVFGQVLNGMDVVDRMLEGDVIDRVEIIQ